MSRPEGIEQGVWDSAAAIERLYHSTRPLPSPSLSEMIAGAIMAAKTDEREACIGIVLSETKAPRQRNAKDQWVEQIGQQVADAIRTRGYRH